MAGTAAAARATAVAARAGTAGGRGVEEGRATRARTQKTGQEAESQATNKQTNLNVPVSVLSYGSNNGDVNQSNHGSANSPAENNNTTQQGNWQNQNGTAKGSNNGGGEGSNCGCEVKKG